MANPPVLLCDADALYQLLMGELVQPIRCLKEKYGIQPVVVAEVDLDIRGNSKLISGIGGEYKKALTNGTLAHFDETKFNALPPLPKHTTFADIQTRGRRYNLLVGRGEAYSHAAGYCMGVPVMSNDWDAIQILKGRGYELPSPILRAFDLVCFGHQVGVLDIAACDKFRKKMNDIGEHIPKAFQKASFAAGLTDFCPRITCTARASIGRTPSPSSQFDQVVAITPIK
jgi:hypothetical protein